MNPDGSGLEVYARGLRNTVGFDWDPQTKELWFTDNGRDNLGDDVPPDKLNHASRAGLRFGFPYCHGGTIPDPDFGRKHACCEFAAPAQSLGPHVASLGMRFYTGNAISRGVPESDFHRRAWLLEPQQEDRLPRDDGEARRRQGDPLRALRRRLAAGRERMGAPG